MSDRWIVVEGAGQLGAALDALGQAGGGAAALVVGTRELAEQAARAVAEVRWIDVGAYPAEAWAEAAAAELARAGAAVVVGASTPGGRAIVGAAAARLDAPLVANALAVRPEAGAVEVEQSDLDGRLLVSLRAPAPVCVLVEASDARAPELGQPGAVVEVRAAPGPVERLAVDAAPADATRLADAERVVAVGLGLGSADALPAVERLARALDAEIAGSMPAATAGWVPHERYVGLSGQQISPALYLALGISGAPQHLAGIRGAKMVVAVDTDARAPIFRAAEYGIVGDLREVVPALTEALAASGG